MKRRDMILGLGAAGLLGACSGENQAPAVRTDSKRRFRWHMVTTWPKNFPGMGTAVEDLAARIGEMSGGRLTVRVYGAGERVPALEVFDAVSSGAAQMGHGAAYYWKGKSPAAPFFTTVPFGLTSWEMSAWLHYGGGMELWRELYADFGLVPFGAGNTGTQMGGWFREPIADLARLDSLKMRIPGLGGEVMQRLGVTTVNIPGGELFTSMQTGVIDAVEWVGPYNDLAFGLHKLAKHYYYPGWHEPGAELELIVNADAWNELPGDLQAVVAAACAASGAGMTAELAARNQQALRTLVDEHGVQLHQFPDDVLRALRRASTEVLDELVAGDAFARKVYDSYKKFAGSVAENTRLGELAYLKAREST